MAPDTVRDISQDVPLLSAPSPTFVPQLQKMTFVSISESRDVRWAYKGWGSHRVTCRAQSILSYCAIPLSSCTGWLPSDSPMIAANAESTSVGFSFFLTGAGSLETLIGCLESTGGDQKMEPCVKMLSLTL